MKKNRVELRFIIISTIVFIWLIIGGMRLLNQDSIIYKIFEASRDGDLSSKISSQIKLFFSEKIMNVFFEWSIYISDIAITILYISISFYLINLILFEKVTIPHFSRNRLSDLKKWKTAKLWLPSLMIYTPFVIVCAHTMVFYIISDKNFNLHDLFESLFLLSIIIILMFLKIEQRSFKTITIIQLIVTVVLIVVVLFYTRLFKLSELWQITYTIFAVVGVLRGLFQVFVHIIKQDYRAATIAKENVSTLHVIPRRCKKNLDFLLHPLSKKSNEQICSIIDRRTRIPLICRKIMRAEIIRTRNHNNFYFTAYLVFLSFSLEFFITLFNFKKSDQILIILCLVLFFRYLSRSIEISVAFYKDIIKSEPKKSFLGGNDRLKLAIASLIEVSLLATIIEYTYRLFLGEGKFLDTYLTGDYVTSVVQSILQHFATQIFNYSFISNNDLFVNIIHTIQISTGFCLILLAIASYLGMKSSKIEYEVTAVGEQLILKKIIKYNSNKLMFNEKIIDKNISSSTLDRSWSKNIISTDEYVYRKRALLEWELWKNENEALKNKWIKK